jgi:hypothetical protein
MKGNHKCETISLITRKYFKEEKIDINIIKEEDGILINIHGTGRHKTTLQQDIIRDQ